MPDDQNTTQNPISTENPSPTSPQEPIEPAPENTSISEPTEALPEVPEAQQGDFEVKSNNIPPSNSTLTEQENEPKIEEKSGENKPEIEPVSGPKQEVSESQTAQIPVFEPLASKLSQRDLWRKFLDKVQIGKKKKLEKIMALFLEKSKITNDEVEKLLHVSDATATRYLSQLEKEGKIQQSGKTGKGVSYSRI
jgi:hypothetical protein